MKRLLILSGKGGTGKTTVAAAFIALSGARAVADCDVDAPNLHLMLEQRAAAEKTPFIGAQKAHIDPTRCIGCGACAAHCRFGAFLPGAAYRVNEYACEGCGVCAYVCRQDAVSLCEDVAGEKTLTRGERVFSTATLRMGRGNSGKLVTEVKLAMLKNAPDDAPLAIIDGSPGIGCPVIASVSGMDLVLVVAEPSLSGISDLERLVKTAQTFRAKLAVCVNKWDVSPQNTQAIEDFCRAREIPFVGRIPYDKAACAAVNRGESLLSVPSPAADALRQVYAQTMNILTTK